MHNGKNLKDKHMNKTTKDLKPVLTLALEALEEIGDQWGFTSKLTIPNRKAAITAICEALMSVPDGAHAPTEREQPAPATELREQQSAERGEPVSGVVIREGLPALLQDRNIKPTDQRLYTSPQPAPVAEPHEQHDCSRSHPHENMDAMCELRTEIARLTNENARLKAKQQSDEVNAYRMTLLCIRDGLQQGMSKSIQKLQAREINDVLGMPSFASYRTSPSASPSQGDIKPWVGLTQQDINIAFDDTQEGGGFDDFARAIEAKLREKNEHREKNA